MYINNSAKGWGGTTKRVSMRDKVETFVTKSINEKKIHHTVMVPIGGPRKGI